ncbi:MAG: hypothetical protein WA996_01085 [Candidatus Promineifilaceae bacterium]
MHSLILTGIIPAIVMCRLSRFSVDVLTMNKPTSFLRGPHRWLVSGAMN